MSSSAVTEELLRDIPLDEGSPSLGEITRVVRWRSASFAAAVHRARRFARSGAPVLITGERGVGKRVFARAIHADSYGSHDSFLHLDCTAVSSKAFEAALEGEALTAAGGGSAPISSEGTLFLEEVAALDAGRQAKVLAYLADSFHGCRNGCLTA